MEHLFVQKRIEFLRRRRSFVVYKATPVTGWRIDGMRLNNRILLAFSSSRNSGIT